MHCALTFVSALFPDHCFCTAPRPLCLHCASTFVSGEPPLPCHVERSETSFTWSLCQHCSLTFVSGDPPPYLVMLSGAKHLSLVFVSALCLDLCVCTVQKILHFVQDDIGEVQCDTSDIVKSLKCLSISLLYG